MDKIREHIKQGIPVVLPTETVYGLFARALDEAAVERVYALKQRPVDKAMNLNIASFEDIMAYSTNQPSYLKDLVDAFLPGPLTIILKANRHVPSWINSGLSTVGFRMPAHPETLALIKEFGPLVGPSANISGQPSGKLYDEILKDFDEQVLGIKDDAALTGQDSTILDLSGGKARILRQGTITQQQLEQTISELVFETDN